MAQFAEIFHLNVVTSLTNASFIQIQRLHHTLRMQWRIQEFPEGEYQPLRRWTNLLFGNIFAENCMKIKETGPREGAHVPSAPLIYQ